MISVVVAMAEAMEAHAAKPWQWRPGDGNARASKHSLPWWLLQMSISIARALTLFTSYRKIFAQKKIASIGAILFHWLLIIFKYRNFGVSFIGVFPSVVLLQQFCHPNFNILLLALCKILTPVWKSQIFASMQSYPSRDYFKFICGYLLSMIGCIFMPKKKFWVVPQLF